MVVASKVSPTHLAPAELRKACDASLRRLKSDYIDLYQVHWPNPQVPLAETMAALARLRQQGKIRFAGVSNFGARYLREALSAGEVVSDQLPYSLLWRPIEHEVQPFCAERGVSILCYSPMCQGLLTGKFARPEDVPPGRARSRLFRPDRPQARHRDAGFEEGTFAALDRLREICRSAGVFMGPAALAWALAQPAVTSVIAGARSAEQARANAAAGDLELPADVLAALAEATEPVKQYAGANCDMWQSQSRIDA